MKELQTREGAINYYKRIYRDYAEAEASYRFNPSEVKRHLIIFKRGQVVEAGYLLKSLYNFTDSELDKIEKEIEGGIAE